LKKPILVGAGIIPLIFVGWFFSISVGEYPQLNTCFKTSISKKLLCSVNPDYVQLKDVSAYFLEAIVMSEDDKFYAHDGFDWRELRKSMAANLRQFAFVRGGSTITQQLVKNVYLSRDKTISRKIVEAKLAKRIEKKHSKKLILEKYVNAIEFGKNLWGIKQASKFYFDKPPSLLNPLEATYLVILLPSPVRYSRTFFKKELSSYQKRRMISFLRRMKRRKTIDEDYYETLIVDIDDFLKDSDEDIQILKNADLFEAEVVEPEDGEMSDTEVDSNEADGAEPEEKSLDKEQSEETYSEEGADVEDDAPDYDDREAGDGGENEGED